jgi:hypothetical protein
MRGVVVSLVYKLQKPKNDHLIYYMKEEKQRRF